MPVSNNRDYKTSARCIQAQIVKHFERMSELIRLGNSREDASRIAYAEIKGANDAARKSRRVS